jgi:hypothetical protein
MTALTLPHACAASDLAALANPAVQQVQHAGARRICDAVAILTIRNTRKIDAFSIT